MSLLERRARPLAKVCGLTREDDVRAALDAGADLIGLVVHPPSPRHLDEARLAELARLVRGLGGASVLVVVDAERAAVEALVGAMDLDAVQLCGSERPEDWRGAPFPLLRRLGVDGAAPEELGRWRDVAGAFVLDHPAAPGGTGRAVDLARAAALARQAPCLLAGGLDADAVAAFERPQDLLGFDASSRLESSPGRKDPGAVRRYVAAVHAAVSHTEGPRGSAPR